MANEKKILIWLHNYGIDYADAEYAKESMETRKNFFVEPKEENLIVFTLYYSIVLSNA